MVTSKTLRTTLRCMCHSAHIFRCSYSSRATRKLLVDNGCSSPELCNPIQYCLACRKLSIPPDVKISSKNTPRYGSRIIVFKKRFHSKRSTLFWPTVHDHHRSWRHPTQRIKTTLINQSVHHSLTKIHMRRNQVFAGGGKMIVTSKRILWYYRLDCEAGISCLWQQVSERRDPQLSQRQ